MEFVHLHSVADYWSKGSILMLWFRSTMPGSSKLSLDCIHLVDYIKKPEKVSPEESQIYKLRNLEEVLTTILGFVLRPNH